MSWHVGRLMLPLVAALAMASAGPASSSDTYDLVLQGGRVIDPESGLDGIRNVGIRAGRVAAVSSQPLRASEVVDVSGLVVAPGFINLHSHAWTPLGQRFELQDGVTTALELEAGAFPVEGFGTHAPIAIAGRSRINFGASVGHAWVRSAVLEGEHSASGSDELVADSLRGVPGGLSMNRPAFRQRLSPAQLETLRHRLNEGLDQGGLGIGVLLDYMSDAVDETELRAIFEVAAERQAPLFIHIRRGVAGDTAGLREVLRLAGETGAPLHVCHLQANAMGNIAEFLALIRAARAEGVRVTTESFPYNAGSTSISAEAFDRDWQRIFGISYGDVEWAATGERLTEQTWNAYRRSNPGGIVIHHYNREEWTRVASIAPDVAIASDGLPVVSLQGKVAPFGIGTYARVFARYVRQQRALSLAQAITKASLLPARVLQGYSPAFRRKGRIRVGADADLTVFDSARIEDHATYAAPFEPSTGIRHVIVGGVFALRDGEVLENSFPGSRILR